MNKDKVKKHIFENKTQQAQKPKKLEKIMGEFKKTHRKPISRNDMKEEEHSIQHTVT